MIENCKIKVGNIEQGQSQHLGSFQQSLEDISELCRKDPILREVALGSKVRHKYSVQRIVFECRVLFPVILLILEVAVGHKNCMKMICRLEFNRPSCRRFKQCLQDISRRSSLGVPDHGISFFPGKTSNKV